MTTVKITSWNQAAVMKGSRDQMAKRLNSAAAIGVTVAMARAPRDTGFMASTIEVVKKATAQDLTVQWGNITALYTLWQEIGSQGRPGRYFLRQSLQAAMQNLNKAASA